MVVVVVVVVGVVVVVVVGGGGVGAVGRGRLCVNDLSWVFVTLCWESVIGRL